MPGARITSVANFDELHERLLQKRRDRAAQLMAYDPREGQRPVFALRWVFATLEAYTQAVQIANAYREPAYRAQRGVQTLDALRSTLQAECDAQLDGTPSGPPEGTSPSAWYLHLLVKVSAMGLVVQEVEAYEEETTLAREPGEPLD